MLHLRYEREISELLNLPETLRQAVLIPTAYWPRSRARSFSAVPRSR
jgi:hypothetical protein